MAEVPAQLPFPMVDDKSVKSGPSWGVKGQQGAYAEHTNVWCMAVVVGGGPYRRDLMGASCRHLCGSGNGWKGTLN